MATRKRRASQKTRRRTTKKARKVTFRVGATLAQGMKSYCLRCRTKRGFSVPRKQRLKNGAHALVGRCAHCGTKMVRLLPRKR